MKNLLAFAAILLFIGCSKSSEQLPSCKPAMLLSEKFTIEHVFIRTDTLWQDSKLCGDDLKRIEAEKDSWITSCAGEMLEHWYYVVGGQLLK